MNDTLDNGPEDPNDAERTNIISAALVNRFGGEACRVVDDQIASADSEEARAIWTAVWGALCSQEARRA